MNTKTFKEAYQDLTRNCTPLILDRDRLDLVALLNILTKQYLNTEIQDLQNVNPDADMLLFEYGNYDWTGIGEKFNFSIKRQIFLKGIEECGYFGFTIYFETEKIGKIEEFSKWCKNKSQTANWMNEIKASIGYQKVLNIDFERIEFKLEKPH